MQQHETLLIAIKGDATDYIRGVNKAKGASKGFGAGLAKLGKTIAKSVTVAVVALTTALVGLFKGFIKAGKELENYRVILQQLYGDAQKANDVLGYMMELQIKTPYNPKDLMDAAVGLEKFGVDAKEYVSVIGDASAAMGYSGEEMAANAMAFGRAMKIGSAGMRQLRMRFGVDMSDLVKISGKSADELSNNQAAFQEALVGFFKQERFKGGMERLAKTFSGVLSSIGGIWTDFQMKVGKQVNDIMKGSFGKLLDWLLELSESGQLQEWADRLAGAFQIFWDALGGGEGIEEFLGTMMEVLIQLAEILGGVLGTGLKNLMEILGQLMPFVGDLVEAIMPSVSRVLEVVVDVLGTLLDALGPSFIKIFDLLMPFVARIVEELLPPLVDLLVDLLMPALELLTPILEILISILDPILSVLGTLIGLLADLSNLLVGSIKRNLEEAKKSFQGIKDVVASLVDVFNEGWRILKEKFPILQDLEDIFIRVKNAIQDAIEKVLNFFGILSRRQRITKKDAEEAAKAAKLLDEENEDRATAYDEKIQKRVDRILKQEKGESAQEAYKNALGKIAEYEAKLNDGAISMAVRAAVNEKLIAYKIALPELATQAEEDVTSAGGVGGVDSGGDKWNQVIAPGTAGLEQYWGLTYAEAYEMNELMKEAIEVTGEQTVAVIDYSDALARWAEEVRLAEEQSIAWAQRIIDTLGSIGQAFKDTFKGILTDFFEPMRIQVEENATAFQKMGASIVNSLIDMFANIITTVLVKGLLLGVIVTILDALIPEAKIGTAMVKLITGDVGFTGGGLGKTMAKLLGLGDVAGTASAAGRAGGGDVSAGRPYWVGEREPELFVPKQSGSIFNMEQLSNALQPAMAPAGAMAGGVHVHLEGGLDQFVKGIRTSPDQTRRQFGEELGDALDLEENR